MKIIKTVNNYELNEGDGMANGLWNVSTSDDVSVWFGLETKNKFMNMSDENFIIEADKLIKL